MAQRKCVCGVDRPPINKNPHIFFSYLIRFFRPCLTFGLNFSCRICMIAIRLSDKSLSTQYFLNSLLSSFGKSICILGIY